MNMVTLEIQAFEIDDEFAREWYRETLETQRGLARTSPNPKPH